MARANPRTLLETAVKAGEAREYAKAIELLIALLAETDEFPEAYLLLGRSRQALGEHGKAIEALRAYLRAGGDEASGRFFLGRALLAAGRPAEAVQALRRSLELEGESAQAWAFLGAALLKLKRSRAAVECMERATTLAPEDGRIRRGYLNSLFVRSARLVAQGETDLARQMLGYLIAEGMDGPAPRLLRARALREMGRPAEAIVDCEAALRAAPEDQSIRLLRAGLLMAAGRRSEALAEFESLGGASVPPDEAMLQRLRAFEAFKDGRIHEAAKSALDLLKEGGPDPALHALVAECLGGLGQTERSLEHWRQAVKGDPRSPDLRMGLALALFEAGDYAACIETARSAESLGAPRSEADYCRLLAQARIGKDPEGLLPLLQTMLAARIRADQGVDHRLFFALGETLYKSGMPDLAAGWFDKVLALEPRHELALLYAISAAESSGDDSTVRNRYEAYLRAYPDNEAVRRQFLVRLADESAWQDLARAAEAGMPYGGKSEPYRRLYARALREAGKFREAALLYRDLLRERPEDGDMLIALALCLDRDGKADYALSLLEKAPAASKEKAAPWIVMGILRSRKGRTEGALDAMRKAIELEPGNERALRDLARLYERAGLREFAANSRERLAGLARSKHEAAGESILQTGDGDDSIPKPTRARR